MKPTCTIFKNFGGPECGDDAVSLNDYGGFQCAFHDSIPRCQRNAIGPVTPIAKDAPNAVELLRQAFDKYLANSPNKNTAVGSCYGTTITPAHNVP